MHSHVCEHQSAHWCTHMCVYMKVAHQWRDLSEVSVWKDGGGQTVSNDSSLRSYTPEHYLSEEVSICSEFWGQNTTFPGTIMDTCVVLKQSWTQRKRKDQFCFHFLSVALCFASFRFWRYSMNKTCKKMRGGQQGVYRLEAMRQISTGTPLLEGGAKVRMFPFWLQLLHILQYFTFPRRMSTQEMEPCVLAR